VTALEERLGVTLLQRTTRKLSLTAQGHAYYNQCSEPLSHLFDAERALTQTQKKPEGLLRISAPVILGQETFYQPVEKTRFHQPEFGLIVTPGAAN
jgi:DNA-binding transcriptional LysR family regulator